MPRIIITSFKSRIYSSADSNVATHCSLIIRRKYFTYWTNYFISINKTKARSFFVAKNSTVRVVSTSRIRIVNSIKHTVNQRKNKIQKKCSATQEFLLSTLLSPRTSTTTPGYPEHQHSHGK